jgi:stearoyl-CoA desaturase (delta-9 desaturase)
LAAIQLALLLGLGFGLGWDAALWGVFVRLCVGYHFTWLINSATHKWGYRNYETNEDSRNCWWVALVTFGEGWHNNHHADDRACRAGRKPWELDVTFWVIKVLEKLGLVWDVVPPREDRLGAGHEPAKMQP